MPVNGSAPTFAVPMREIVALEHPMILKNIDSGLKTLGSGVPLQQVSVSLQCEEPSPAFSWLVVNYVRDSGTLSYDNELG
jgi:general transcription factor 3C polypeptide 5 (transcription factor C subunit 1)